mmetsp:Transcript_42480/g.113534  ORF Transcript_42480/g.113534 Transcript_42480/m.113534 type:complete len:232 (-) Transcript_42480:510-1205(-)
MPRRSWPVAAKTPGWKMTAKSKKQPWPCSKMTSKINIGVKPWWFPSRSRVRACPEQLMAPMTLRKPCKTTKHVATATPSPPTPCNASWLAVDCSPCPSSADDSHLGEPEATEEASDARRRWTAAGGESSTRCTVAASGPAAPPVGAPPASSKRGVGPAPNKGSESAPGRRLAFGSRAGSSPPTRCFSSRPLTAKPQIRRQSATFQAMRYMAGSLSRWRPHISWPPLPAGTT